MKWGISFYCFEWDGRKCMGMGYQVYLLVQGFNFFRVGF